MLATDRDAVAVEVGDQAREVLSFAWSLNSYRESPRTALRLVHPWLQRRDKADFGGWEDTQAVIIAAEAEFRLGRFQRTIGLADLGRQLAVARNDAVQVALAEAARARAFCFLGRYSEGIELFSGAADVLTTHGEEALAARARAWQAQLHISRAEFDIAASVLKEAIAQADACGAAHAQACARNFLGLCHLNRALVARLSELSGHWYTALDPDPDNPANEVIDLAADTFAEATRIAEQAGLDEYALLIRGNGLRAGILRGEAAEAATFLRGHIKDAQQRGLTNEEMARRHTRAWALRLLKHYREALHELQSALGIARRIGQANRMVGYAHYDASVIYAALGRFEEAQQSYQRFARHVLCWNRRVKAERQIDPAPSMSPRPLLEPFYLKRADAYLAQREGRIRGVEEVAVYAGVSLRTLQLAFKRFRGTTVVAHARNLRLDRARQDLDQENGSVGEIATRHGFESATTFSLEFRRRYGVTPSAVRRMGRRI